MNNKQKGDKGEQLVVDFLIKEGFEILETNWRWKRCEVDIIAKVENILVFVEVKTRTNTKFGLPEESVSKHKQQQLQQAADEYIFQNNHNGEIRFDVVAVNLSKKAAIEIHHIKDAFFGFQE